METLGYKQHARNVLSQVANAFFYSGIQQTDTFPPSIRSNSLYPSFYHTHKNQEQESLRPRINPGLCTFDFTQNGTWGHSGKKEGNPEDIDGQEYPIGCGHIFLACALNMPHKADYYTPTWPINPRINFVL